MGNPDHKGETTIPADTDGQGYVRVVGRCLADVLKACGGMADFKLASVYSPMLFAGDGSQLTAMPIMSAKQESKRSKRRKRSQKREELTEA